jgi:hypothetical protein
MYKRDGLDKGKNELKFYCSDVDVVGNGLRE